MEDGYYAWMIVATALVLMMTTPALAFFYGGMTRTKSTLNMMMMSFTAMGVVGIAFILWGWSMGWGGDGIGNGRAAAILLAKAGARVVVVDRDKALAGRTVEMIREVEGEAIALEADVTQARDCAAMVQAALDTFGRLDLLDNNVGIGSRGSVVDEPEETWRRVMQVNVESMFLAAKHAIPAMRRAGGGSIVNISSIEGVVGTPYCAAYTASKFGVRGITKVAALEHGKDGIRVNSVHPGGIDTPMTRAVMDEDGKKYVGKRVPGLKRMGEAEEIANVVAFLASDDASYCTGAEFVVDGGVTASSGFVET